MKKICLAPNYVLPCEFEQEGECSQKNHCNFKYDIDVDTQTPKLETQPEKGDITKSGNHTLKKKIVSLEEFWDVINKEKSLYARHRMYPTAFFFSWTIKLIVTWLDAGYFWTTTAVEQEGSQYKD